MGKRMAALARKRIQKQGEHRIRKRIYSTLLVLAFLTGLSLLLYPTVSDYYNSLHQSRAIAEYSNKVKNLKEEEYEELLQEARDYNEKLANRGTTSFVLSDEEMEEYESLLNIDDVMGYIEIPSIDCSLPIYHGDDEATLQVGVGHVAGSSLPVGGSGTHCVLSGHRGLPSAKLFTNLDQLAEGDTFIIRTLNETLTYEVDQIRIVEPEDVSDLQIIPGEDLCTLVTCTPYGINTQRLLVRGHRVDNTETSEAIRVTAEAVQLQPILVAPFAAIPILFVMLIWVLRHNKNESKRKDDENDGENDIYV
jgi:sortase A